MEKCIYLSLTFFLLIFFGCSEKTKKSENINNVTSKIDSVELERQIYFKSLLKKTTSIKGNFIDYKFLPNSNEKFQIIWGNGNFTSVLRDTFEGTNPANVPALIKDTLDYLILHCDCGSECTIDIFLNTINPKLIGNFINLQDYDLKKGIFIYRDFQQPSTNGEAIVSVNIINGKKYIENVGQYLSPDTRAVFDDICYKNGFLLYDLNKSCSYSGKRVSKKIKLNIE